MPETRQLTPDDLRELYDEPGPHVRGGMVLSADGSTTSCGVSGTLHSPGDAAVFATLRGVADAVLVGAGTVRAEGYGPLRLSPADRAWRSRRGRGPSVPLVVVSRSLDLPADAAWLRAEDTIVITGVNAPSERRAPLAAITDLLVCGDEQVDLAAALELLADRGLRRVLCEGGPSLLGDLARAGLLTELCTTLSPLLVGAAPGLLAGGLRAPLPLRLAHLAIEQSTLLARWRIAEGSDEPSLNQKEHAQVQPHQGQAF